MRICFICNEYPPSRHGGIGSAVRTLGRALVRAGHEVRVIGFYPDSERAPDREWDEGVSVLRLKVPSSLMGAVRGRYLTYSAVARWVRSGLVDIIEAPDYQGLIAGWSSLSVPVVVRLHGSSSYFSQEMGKRPDAVTLLLERLSLKRANFLCSCSRYTAEETRRLFGIGTDIRIIHNPVSTLAAPSEANRRPGRVVFSGTLAIKKGVVPLIRAWAKVVEACPFAELQMFGKDGRTDAGASMQDHLMSLLPSSAQNSVRFFGHVDFQTLRSAFQSATAAVFPSYAEAFALAPMEAMAEGCPTIYSARGSGRELIEDGQNGRVVDPDDVPGIADAIISILRNEVAARKFGRLGRESIERRFSLDVLLPRNIEFYADCAKSSACRRTADQPIESVMPTDVGWRPGA